MPFGLHNALTTYQRSLDLILFYFRFKTFLFYRDDVLIVSHKLEDHVKQVGKVLTLLEKADVSIKRRKSQLFCKSLDYLSSLSPPKHRDRQ